MGPRNHYDRSWWSRPEPLAVRLIEGLGVTLRIAYAGCACSRTPSALATFKIVAKLGLPFALSAR